MKAIKIFAALFMLFAVSASVGAQNLSKADQKLLKKSVKEYKSQGWQVNPGQLPLETQVTKAFEARLERDSSGGEAWITGEGRSIGTIYDAARTQALSFSRGEIANKLTTQVSTTISEDLANEQYGNDEAESVAKTIMAREGRSVDQSIKRPITLMECFRKLSNGNTEVLIIQAISSENVEKLAKAALQRARRDNLLKDVEKLKNQE
ncbi:MULTISPECIES: hypothetical protein [unclassified Prevotella]|uniref:hypothetical protein n=1 Tax=unclassified Prevotella TaxID=2638335 RepID=UPI000490DFE3|nr:MULTISPECIES: hypothetical protein [unclassified Prevotella]